MKHIKHNACSVLSLVLKGKWYDMIASGEKHEEYRDETKYWRVRVDNWQSRPEPHVVEFRRGYVKNAPKMWFVSKGVELRCGCANHDSWGEPVSSPHYAISLNARVDLS